MMRSINRLIQWPSRPSRAAESERYGQHFQVEQRAAKGETNQMTSAAKPARATMRAAPGRAGCCRGGDRGRQGEVGQVTRPAESLVTSEATFTRRLQQALTRVRTPAVTGIATAVPMAMMTGARGLA